jgi:DNA-binding CsgD family transcriptional regulator
MTKKSEPPHAAGLSYNYIFLWKKEPEPAAAMHYSACADEFHRKLYALNAGLTRRELSVCALALVGMTIEGSALELNVKKSTIITYRKRAYERLGISSLNELFSILTFPGRPN